MAGPAQGWIDGGQYSSRTLPEFPVWLQHLFYDHYGCYLVEKGAKSRKTWKFGLEKSQNGENQPAQAKAGAELSQPCTWGQLDGGSKKKLLRAPRILVLTFS